VSRYPEKRIAIYEKLSCHGDTTYWFASYHFSCEFFSDLEFNSAS